MVGNFRHRLVLSICNILLFVVHVVILVRPTHRVMQPTNRNPQWKITVPIAFFGEKTKNEKSKNAGEGHDWCVLP